MNGQGVKTVQRFAYSRNGDGFADEQCPLRISIPSVSTVDHHVRFHIHISDTRSQHAWRISHRYSEFRALHDSLLGYLSTAKSPCPGCQNYAKAIQAFEFPPKHVFTSNSPVVLNYRKRALRAFLALLASHTFTNAPKCPTCKDLPFSALRDFLVTEQPEGVPGSPQAMDADAIRESLDVKGFTCSVPVGQSKAVNSEGHFIKSGDSKKNKHVKVSPDEHKTKAQPAKQASASPMNSTSDSFGSTDSTNSSPTRAARTEQEEETKEEEVTEDKFEAKTTQIPTTTLPQRSVRDSIDNEFGSLNMDFMSESATK